MEPNYWAVAIAAYMLLAIVTLVPFLRTVAAKIVPLNPGGPGFRDAPQGRFSDTAVVLLEQHYERMAGTLGFWKKHAALYRTLNTYIVAWSIIAGIITPILTQAITADVYSRWLLTIIAAHGAALLALSKGYKVPEHLRAYRQGESDFYDLRRRLLDNPRSFGDSEEERIVQYFEAVSNVRRRVRDAETDNFPSVEQVRSIFADQSERGGSA